MALHLQTHPPSVRADAGFPQDRTHEGEAMPLEKKYIRNGRNQLVGSVTSGYSDTTEIARDARGKLLGKSNGCGYFWATSFRHFTD
jgi:hypothetical protein